MYSFHVEVPSGVDRLEVTLDFISPPDIGGFSAGGSATPELAVLSWNQFLLYPAGTPTDQLNFQADLKVPAGWRYGTALPIASESGNTIQFRPSSLTTLIDSPVLSGAHFRTVDLSPGSTPPHYLHIASDSERALGDHTRRSGAPQELDQGNGRAFWSAPLSRLPFSADHERSCGALRVGTS